MWNRFTGVLLISLLLASLSAAQAATVNIGDVIDNGEFGTNVTPSLASWPPDINTVTVNVRPSTDTINTFVEEDDAFINFFSSDFAVLGDY